MEFKKQGEAKVGIENQTNADKDVRDNRESRVGNRGCGMKPKGPVRREASRHLQAGGRLAGV